MQHHPDLGWNTRRALAVDRCRRRGPAALSPVVHSRHVLFTVYLGKMQLMNGHESADFVPKMIATDIDGTMLRSDGSLSPRVRDALHDAADAGIHVVPATGRPEMVATDVIEATTT